MCQCNKEGFEWQLCPQENYNTGQKLRTSGSWWRHGMALVYFFLWRNAPNIHYSTSKDLTPMLRKELLCAHKG